MRFPSWLRHRADRVLPARTRHSPPRLSLEHLEDRVVPSAAHDFLYVGDGGANTVRQFNATTGALVGNLVASGSQGMLGPRGLIFRNPGQLLAVNQNVGTTIPGEI